MRPADEATKARELLKIDEAAWRSSYQAAKRERFQQSVVAWIFIGAVLVIWTAAAFILQSLGPWFSQNWGWVAAGGVGVVVVWLLFPYLKN